MTDLKFSIYGGPSPLEDPTFMFEEFQAQHYMTIQINRMEWDDAWPQLLNYALHGGSPDISHIGAIWNSSLVGMDVLRPFNLPEINSLGSVEAFFAPCWQNAVLASNQSTAWGIPFVAYIYVVLYRRDLLAQAGIDEQTAFASAEAMLETVKRLRAAGNLSPLILPSGDPYRPRVHIAASWIWGAGGDYTNSDGHQILFDQPPALAGLKAFFELYQQLARSDYNLPALECLRRFAEGDSAITILGGGSLPEVRQRGASHVLDNIGIAPIPGITWVGGSNLIVWKETRFSRDKERLAMALTRFLTSAAAQIKYANTTGALPARIEVLPQAQFALPGANEVFAKALQAGRAYQPVRLWARFIGDLSRAYDNVTADTLADVTLDLNQTLAKHLSPVAQRFRLMVTH